MAGSKNSNLPRREAPAPATDIRLKQQNPIALETIPAPEDVSPFSVARNTDEIGDGDGNGDDDDDDDTHHETYKQMGNLTEEKEGTVAKKVIVCATSMITPHVLLETASNQAVMEHLSAISQKSAKYRPPANEMMILRTLAADLKGTVQKESEGYKTLESSIQKFKAGIPTFEELDLTIDILEKEVSALQTDVEDLKVYEEIVETLDQKVQEMTKQGDSREKQAAAAAVAAKSRAGTGKTKQPWSLRIKPPPANSNSGSAPPDQHENDYLDSDEIPYSVKKFKSS